MSSRSKVLWFGAAPDIATSREFQTRQLELRTASNSDSPEPTFARAAIFNFENNLDAVEPAQRLIRDYLDNGLRIELVAPDDRTMGLVQKALPDLITLQGVRAKTAPSMFEIAEVAARHSPGFPPRTNLNIVVAANGRPIRVADRPLFQRAFHNCSKIELVELGGGRSDARVYAVHMTVDGSNAGVWPQPAFAKIDRRDKIEQEYSNYLNYAEAFIPFGCRPNVKEVVRGAENSLLSGNFVSQSESLWDLVRRDVASRAISSLVNETLAGWRDQAYAQDPVNGSVALALTQARIFDPKKLKRVYVEQAEQEGTKADFPTLWEKLLKTKQRHRKCTIHGDLHGENIRVRNSQAILIDLASVAEGAPLTADIAALEVWLAFECPPEADQNSYRDDIWAAEVGLLYQPAAFEEVPGPCAPTSRHAGIVAAVRQLRQLGIAAQSCPTEYQTAIGVQLFRRCQWDDRPPAETFRRVHGYCIAVKLAEDVINRAS